MLALDEVVDHAALDRAGTVERIQGGEVFDGVGLVAAQHVAHAVRFKLEDAGGQPGVEDLLVGFLVVEVGGLLQRNVFSPRVCSISLTASSRMVSVVSPRKSIFSRPSFSMAFMSKAVTISSFLVLCSGTRSVSGRGEITTPAAWTPAVAHQAFQFLGGIDQFLAPGVALVGLLQRRRFLERLLELDVQRGGDHLGDAVHVAVRHVHGAAHVLDGRLGRHGAEGDDLRHVLAAVLVGDVIDHFAAPVHAEVDVDIGHGDALGIQKALEEQIVLQRIDVGDPHGVGDQRAGRRAAARAHGNAVFPGVADEVPDDQEIAGKLHLLDDARFRAPAAVRIRQSMCLSRPWSPATRSASSRRRSLRG